LSSRACSLMAASSAAGSAGGGGVGDFAMVVGRAGKSGAPSLSNRFGGSYQRQLALEAILR
jgi:hypothetical protein